MLRSYINVLFRNFLSDGLYSVIIVFGLAVGIAVSLIVAQYVSFEYNFDRQYKDGDRICYAYLDWAQGSSLSDQQCHPAIAPLIKKSVSAVESAIRIAPAGFNRGHEWVLKREKDGAIIDFGRIEHMYVVDPEFFEFFSIPLLTGNAKTALVDPHGIVLTKSVADKFFPNESPLDKTLSVLSLDYRVTGVIDDPAPNSSLQYSALYSFNFWKHAPGMIDLDQSWEWPAFQTFIKLTPGTDRESAEKTMNQAAATHFNTLQKAYGITQSIRLYPFNDFHFYKPQGNIGGSPVVFTGDKRILGFFSALAILILTICWANYINLTIARALRRAKEVGLRKVSGAARSNLVVQFLSEFLFLNLLSLLVALTITQGVFRIFAAAIGSRAEWVLWKDPLFWVVALLFLIVSTMASGIYPAFVMSNYNPVKVLKGNFSRSESGIKLRKALVLMQFGLSAFLLMSIYVISRQLYFMQTKELGLSTEQVMVVRLDDLDSAVDRHRAFDKWKTKLRNREDTKMHSLVSNYPGDKEQRAQVYNPKGDPQNTQTMEANVVSEDYFEAMDIPLLHGRTFRDDYPFDSTTVVINETAAHALGYENAESSLGQEVVFSAEKQAYVIVGIVKDFSTSLKLPFYSSVFHKKTLSNGLSPTYFMLKLSTKNILSTVSDLENEWNILFNTPFDYFFLDTYFDTFYKEERQFAGVFGFFSVVGVVITCLGLFGLSMYNTGSRAKEIGIRKSLGASSARIMWLFSKEYLGLVLTAGIVCIPIGAWLLDNWLKNYPNRIDFGVDFILVPLVLMVVIAQISVGYQTYKAAHSNPVVSLRDA